MENFNILKSCPLFDGIDKGDMMNLLGCLSAVERRYEKGDFIFMAGENVTTAGIVLSGEAHVIQEDFWGNRTILASVGVGGLFGEAFSCAQVEKLPVSVVAVRQSEILLIDYRRIITVCSTACIFHTRLIKNMLHILAKKNVMLTQKMEVLSRRTTREKLLAYLSSQAQAAGGNSFEIPFNRQELAEYLCVDRSAMSGELSRMRDDGIITYQRNRFELL